MQDKSSVDSIHCETSTRFLWAAVDLNAEEKSQTEEIQH
jgi:hypothetical protein